MRARSVACVSAGERPALEALAVAKRFGNRQVLSGVDLIAQSGRLHGLLGPNGAGKTTLMRVLLGLVRRDSGTVRLLGCGVNPTNGSLPDGVAGFVETPAFYPYLSGRRNLALLAHLDRHDGAVRRPGAGHVLEQVGLSGHAEIAVAHYSAGMRQRLGLAAALLRSPRLLFLDEPTNSLDPAGARDVRAVARRLVHEGAAVVWSSHDMAEVEELCATLTIINRGCVIFAGTVDELQKLAPASVHSLRTSDDRAALSLAAQRQGPHVKVAPARDGGLEVSAATDALDAYVIALGCAGVAVRVLERRTRSLESLFLELTGSAGRREALGPASRADSSGRQAAPVVS
ncbi:MAG: ABC transporter ATP-binding protein [Acidobacteriota bacterium]